MTGKILQVNGSVVDVFFDTKDLPKMNEALTVEVGGKTKYMEVAQHLGEGKVRCIMLSACGGISRNLPRVLKYPWVM